MNILFYEVAKPYGTVAVSNSTKEAVWSAQSKGLRLDFSKREQSENLQLHNITFGHFYGHFTR